jgi:GNAT superfamily N-acetyltransferase
MIRLAEEFFDMKNDPEQISVDGESMAKLKEIHPATMSEEKDENGPIAWILVIPTAHALMEAFIQGEINERELLDRTLPGRAYDALYLCSALVLPEHRGKGLARRLTSRAIGAIRHDHPLRSLFYWSFSAGGDSLAASVARECGLPLYRRQSAPPSLI